MAVLLYFTEGTILTYYNNALHCDSGNKRNVFLLNYLETNWLNFKRGASVGRGIIFFSTVLYSTNLQASKKSAIVGRCSIFQQDTLRVSISIFLHASL